ncbi:BA75_03997T0 [Komagataella pastoris]|uniref:BA75_03997T0 n=1 Tax=Komagataella pastoris TaxID=4922 RepID=A0A1B2JEJ7_PICPA|nr:BA75_03997T0 [Komagataella pastoris]
MSDKGSNNLTKLKYSLVLLTSHDEIKELLKINLKQLEKHDLVVLDEVQLKLWKLSGLLSRVEQSFYENDPTGMLKVTMRAARNFNRWFLLLFGSLSMVFKILRKLNIANSRRNLMFNDRVNLLKFSISLGLLFSVKPLFNSIIDIFAESYLKITEKQKLIFNSVVSNLFTSIVSFALYPSKIYYQKNYASIYFTVLMVEYGYKFLEQVYPAQFSKESSSVYIIKDSDMKDTDNPEPEVQPEDNYFIRRLKVLKSVPKRDKLLRSWYLFPLCYSQIFKSFIMDYENCPVYFRNILNFMGEGLLVKRGASRMVSSGDMVKSFYELESSIGKNNIRNRFAFDPRNFLLRYLPRKYTVVLEYLFPFFLFMNLKLSTKELERLKAASKWKYYKQILIKSLKESLKLSLTVVTVSSTSLLMSYYTTKGQNPSMSWIWRSLTRVPFTFRLHIIGLLSGFLVIFYSKRPPQDTLDLEIEQESNLETTATYRSIWLYILRMTLISSMTKHNSNERKHNFFTLDKILLTLSFTGLISIKDSVSLKKADMPEDLSSNIFASKKWLSDSLDVISDGSTLAM